MAPPAFPAEVARRLQREHAEAGDIEVALSWNNHNDLDLHCVEPDGGEIQFSHKGSKSGGKLDGATFQQLIAARAAERRETYPRCK